MIRLGPRRAVRGTVLVSLGLFIIFSIQSWDGDSSLFDPSVLGSGFYAAVSGLGQSRDESAGEAPHYAPAIQLPSYCNKLNVNNIAFITKTGATEAKDKLLSQLATSLSCVSDPLIFSDLQQTLGLFQIHDVLSRVSKAATVGNPEFDIYYEQKELASEGREDELRALSKRPAHAGDWRTQGKSAAWSLDKYKFLHMIDRAWEYQPKKDWYVFIETDTYLSLPNLVKFLATQDPKRKLYLGNAMRMWEHPTPLFFAHGGSGFVLSRATVEEFSVARKGISLKYDRRIALSWFGDFIVADALDQYLDIQVTNVSPKLQGENPTNFAFSRENWCESVITLHYMTPRDAERMFEFEKSHGFQGMLYRDVYGITYKDDSIFPSRRAEWDNGANEETYAVRTAPNRENRVVKWGDFAAAPVNDPHSSFEACELACILNSDCLQFSFHTSTERMESECYMSKAVRLGKAVQKDDLEPGESISSGWLNEKIQGFIAGQPSCPG